MGISPCPTPAPQNAAFIFQLLYPFPEKKRKILEVYERISTYLKKAQKGLKSNNVEEVQWWFGDIFTVLCENKEIVDPIIYEKFVQLKNSLNNATSTVLFFHTCFKGAKHLEVQMKEWTII